MGSLMNSMTQHIEASKAPPPYTGTPYTEGASEELLIGDKKKKKGSSVKANTTGVKSLEIPVGASSGMLGT